MWQSLKIKNNVYKLVEISNGYIVRDIKVTGISKLYIDLLADFMNYDKNEALPKKVVEGLEYFKKHVNVGKCNIELMSA